jgi:hypothetical protein
MKVIRRLITLVAVAIRGILSFLTWFEKQEEIDWSDDEDLEEAI